MIALRRLMWLCALALLAACGADNVYAPADAVARARYVDPAGVAYVTLFTVINNQNNSGAHAGLLINGSQRVLFDPAGSWFSPNAPERHDVHYGITDSILRFYIDYHARLAYRVNEQTVQVSQATADRLIAAAEAYGSVPKAQCANAISHVLGQVPEFQSVIGTTWLPLVLSKRFDRLPGVSDTVVFDTDSNDHKAMLVGNANAAAPVAADAPAN
jgi:hypothetical protein